MANPLKFFAVNLSIRKKGLLLVCIPLIFQILLSVSLGILYSQAEQQAWQESRSRLLATRATTICNAMFDAGHTLVAYTATRDRSVYLKWLATKESLLQELDLVKKSSATNSSSPEVYDKLLEVSNTLIKLLDDFFQSAEAGKPRSIYEVYPDTQKALRSLTDAIEFVLTHDLNRQVASTLSEERTRQLIAILLYSGTAVDFVIAIGLSVFFAASIEKRLAVISSNTKLVRGSKPLNPAMEGTDEIADLDREFHDLSTALKQSEQLRSEFISMISHDMKTPLMSVELSLEHVQKKLPLGLEASVQEELQTVSSNMKRVMGLIRDVLDLERGASGKLTLELEELEVGDVLNKVIKSVQALAQQKSVHIVMEARDESVFADRRRLDQVLLNLFSNALKFAPSGSSVVVRVSRKEDFVEIRVTDQGDGVPEKDRNRIFERFEQSTKPGNSTDSGSGLGLAICKAIMDSHGGQIGYKPNVPRGSQFWVCLKSAD